MNVIVYSGIGAEKTDALGTLSALTNAPVGIAKYESKTKATN